MTFERNSINVDITHRCSLKCPRCARVTSPWMIKQNKEISVENFAKITEYFKQITFCGQYSDPIYHREFHQILELCVGKYVNIHTAGHGFKTDWWEEAFDISRYTKHTRWIFALDGLPKDSHKYRVGQDGERVWEIMQLGSKLGMDVEWQYIAFRYNENDIEEAERMANDSGIKFTLMKSNRWFSSDDELMPTNPNLYHWNEKK